MKGYIAWVIPEQTRDMLLDTFPPRYSEVICHHITHIFRVSEDHPLPETTEGKVIGIAHDGEGIEALVVDMGVEKPDGTTHHITLSLDREAGYRPVQSNEVIEKLGFEFLNEPIPLTGLIPQHIPFHRKDD
jgi:hypothetical protein